MISSKKWSILLLALIGVLLTMSGIIIVIVDPFFHYHKPLDVLEYPLRTQRYQNDGIVKHFDYDAIITGSSMTENFKTSEFDNLFNVTSVKVPFSGGSYKEVNDNLQRALKANQNIKIILRGLDYVSLLQDKDAVNYDEASYPSYLYDNVWYNDVQYLLNKSVLLHVNYTLRYTKEGNKTTTFDAYSNWMDSYTFGKETVDKSYSRPQKANEIQRMTDQDYEVLCENLEQNVANLAVENPQVQFYLFFSPYSIYYWDSINQDGTLEKQLETERAAIEFLLEYDNIYLFSFFDVFDMICDLNNYRDIRHYGEDVNSQILKWMYKKEHLLTKENYVEYCNAVFEFYTTYDYDSLFIIDR